MTERVYSPSSVVRNPLALVRQMLLDAKAARYLAWRILVRDLKARYRQTLLGSLWIFIPPVFIAIGLTLATRTKVIQIAATDIPYAAYVIFSMSLWFTFVEAVNAPLNVIEQSRSLLARISFPHEALLIARFADVLVNFLVRVLLVIAVLLLFKVDLFGSAFLAIPAALAVILFGFTVGLFLAPFAALYHDISKGTAIVLYLMLFLTPVIYPPPAGDNVFAMIVNANPVTPLIITVRELATGAALTAGDSFLALASIAVVGFFFAWLLYKVSLPFVIERLSA